MTHQTTLQKNLIAKRTLECAGLMMIGEGLYSAVEPRRHLQLWRSGPSFWRKMVDPFVERPEMTRWIGVAEAVTGFWLASRQRA